MPPVNTPVDVGSSQDNIVAAASSVILNGFSITNESANTRATVNIRNGSDPTGALIHRADISGGSTSVVVGLEVLCENGLFVERVTGASQVTLFYRHGGPLS